MADNIVVLDFETTGLSPNMGDRAIEIGAVRLQHGKIVDQYQALMNPGCRISPFIENYTGISNHMLKDAAPCSEVMAEFAEFIGDSNLLAHNASFDKKFLDAEFARIYHHYPGQFACSLLSSRRIFTAADNHQLATLVKYTNSHSEGTFHRALYDAEMTANVWLKLLASIRNEYGFTRIPFSLIKKLNVTAKKSVPDFLRKQAAIINSKTFSPDNSNI
jgi:DNA polymerase-3 subunit epsilon